MKTIVINEGIVWNVMDEGCLLGIDEKNQKGIPLYEFRIGNPPALNTRHYDLFVAICDFAVAKGILRPIYSYAVA